MKFSLKQLQAFVWVADLGGFRKAAERLNTTQPNISARIAGLEDVLGVTLMERDAGSVRLTAKGQELLNHARQVLRSCDTLVEAADNAALYDGVLRLGVTEMIVHTWLRDFLKLLRDQMPNINVELTVDLSVNLTSELFARSIDLAFQNGPFGRQSAGNADLGTYPLIWVGAPHLGIGASPSLTEMSRHPILTHARDTRSYAEVSAHFARSNDVAPRLIPSSNLAACLHMALEGLGIATLPAAMVIRELEAGELVRLDYDWVPESLQFMARYDTEKTPTFVARAASIANGVAHRFTDP